MATAALTKREQDVLDFLTSYVAENGVPPMLTEIAAGIGVASKGQVHGYVSALEAKGRLQRRKLYGQARYFPAAA
jgi:repressor LexA